MDEHGDRTLDYATQARRIISRAVMNYEMKEGVSMEHVLLQVASMQVCVTNSLTSLLIRL